MRILHVNKFLHRRGGAEAYMLDLAEAQRAEGHDVGFFAMQHPENDGDVNDDLFPARMELNPPPEGLAARVRTAGQIIYRPDARAGMDAVLDRVRPDVVHLHNIYHQLSPSILRPVKKRGIAAVMTLHDYKLACPTYQFLDADGKICEACLPGKFRNATRKRCNQGSLAGSALATIELSVHRATHAYDAVDALICPSEFLRTKMAQGRVYPERLVHLPNFCDLHQITAATQPGAGVLYAGRLSPEKGVDVLVDAAAHLPAGLRVTIAGDGPERAALEKRAADRGVVDRVTFLGRIPGQDLHQQMRDHAVVVVPSRWYENQPMTILEAYAAARPVVGSLLGGLPELIDEGVTGRLVTHDDPTALAAALSEVAGDPAAAHRMGMVARERTHAFSIDTHVRGLDEIYQRVVARHAAAPRGKN
ncbi:MAG: glycosyltransferase [Nocardioides sp.]|uniref:glycosyltransferase n=1 Tax=Nocardioides sp. TaxID=35761 RepID=UPI002388E448|nr:glycosyltransferase [Nocardioides sp.]MDE0775765.1 glycosyltransferase [Nocardioides sp.]